MKRFIPYVIGFFAGSLISGSMVFWYFDTKVREFYTQTLWLGEYVNDGESYHQSVEVTKNDSSNGQYSAYISVGTESGCVGEFKGNGSFVGKTLVLTEPEFNCEMTLILNKETKVLSVVGSNECRNLSGMRCGFDGTYIKER